MLYSCTHMATVGVRRLKSCKSFRRYNDPLNCALSVAEAITNRCITWIGLSMVLRLRQHNIGYTADGFYRSDDQTNSVKALKEGG